MKRLISWSVYILVLCGLLIGSSALLASTAHAYGDMTHEEELEQMTPYFNQVVSAIYLAEGGAKTRHPFGILSVSCNGYEDCRQVCFNTVRNNWFRYANKGYNGDFIAYLGEVYCPAGANNDPNGLNRHWVGNVSRFMESGL